jgi:hypothetical protein
MYGVVALTGSILVRNSFPVAPELEPKLYAYFW